jgi:putative methyltransferase (TIGR04325 family)
VILTKVKSSLLKVKQGEAVYERDSVLFDRINYPFPVLTTLLKTALDNYSQLSVLDFGGSLGSSYYQCKNFFTTVDNFKWCIVEQENFVKTGKQYFEDNHLKFFNSIDECLKSEKPDIILLSSVVQYLEFPYQFLENLVSYNFKYILFDRTAFVTKGDDRLTVQKVPPDIYPASYPSWFLNLDRFLSFFLNKYELVYDFDALDKANIPSQYKGFYFRKIGEDL